MEKLISMTDFVKMQWKKEIKLEQESTQSWHNCKKYSEFISQPLTLGMFVPCDVEGKMIELIHSEFYMSCHSAYHNELNRYSEAKNKLLFKVDRYNYESITLKDGLIIRLHPNNLFSLIGKQITTIEDLAKHNLILTESAKKQIGL